MSQGATTCTVYLNVCACLCLCLHVYVHVCVYVYLCLCLHWNVCVFISKTYKALPNPPSFSKGTNFKSGQSK